MKDTFIEYGPDTTPQEIENLSKTENKNDDESTRYAVTLLTTDRIADAYNYEVMTNHSLGTIEVKDKDGFRTSFDIISNQREFIHYMEMQSRNQLINGEMSELYIEERPFPIVLTQESNVVELNIDLSDKNITRCILQPNLLVYKLIKSNNQMLDMSNETEITINYSVSSGGDKTITRPYNSVGKLLKIPKGDKLNLVKNITVTLPNIDNESTDYRYLIILNNIIISHV